jgi:formylglycine-generating enzyme required for sulfatase activity
METNPSYFRGGPDTPVDSVLWEEALEFCNRLSRREGYQPVYERGEDGWVCYIERTGYRLPVEAEWEFACRAGTVGPLYITPHWLSRREPTPQQIAWYLRNSGGQPQRVGRQEPNPWGLHDMLGNVREWVWDRYDRYPVLREVRLLGSPRGEDRIVRGGGWFSEPKDVRAAARRRWPPDLRWKSVGFRVVRTVER